MGRARECAQQAVVTGERRYAGRMLADPVAPVEGKERVVRELAPPGSRGDVRFGGGSAASVYSPQHSPASRGVGALYVVWVATVIVYLILRSSESGSTIWIRYLDPLSVEWARGRHHWWQFLSTVCTMPSPDGSPTDMGGEITR
eukprot:1185115-Prorocentrum_minimum.AAC.3